MHFLPEFNPTKVDQWGPRVEEQAHAPLTPAKTPATDNANVLPPEFQKLVVKMSWRNTDATPAQQAGAEPPPSSIVQESSQQHSHLM